MVSKALAKEPEERYRSADQMRDDLQRVLSGFSQPEAAATEVLQPREKPALPTELIPNSTEHQESAAPTQFVFPERAGGPPAEVSDQPATSIRERHGDSRHDRWFNKRTKVVVGLTIGMALLIVGFEATGRMSGIWNTDLQHPDPEPTQKLGSPAEITPSSVPYVSPTPEPSPSPSASPDIKGRYSSGGYFNLDIKKTDNRGFTFWLHPGNDHGIGEIDGRAIWNRSSVATFRKSDVSTAKDTGEVLSKAVCRIDFQVVDTSVKVSENSCTDWHGHSPTYNGTYVRKAGPK